MKQCLVIDDSRVMRQIARQIYEKLSFTVTEAQDCDTALACCHQAMPQEIFLDLNMPKANIPMFLRNVRSSREGSTPHILLCTTENDLPTIAEALHAGANDCILKPYDLETISAKVPGETGTDRYAI